MSGFQVYDQIISALTVAKTGRMEPWWKVTSLGGIIGSFHSLWTASGKPTAGSLPGALTARTVDSSTPGALFTKNPETGKTLHLLRAAGASLTSAAVGGLVLVDRLLDYGSINHGSAVLQPLTNVQTLARYTDGAGVMAFLEVSSVLGAGAQSITLTYTNQDGTAGRVGVTTITVSSAVNRICHQTLFLNLQAGDTGIRSVQSVQFDFASSGTSTLVLCRPMPGYLPVTVAAVMTERDYVLQIPTLPELFSAHALQWIWQMSAAISNPAFQGEVGVASN